MYKVLIVDDEPIIRKGLRNIINWKNYGCEVIAEAEDGQDGLELIREHRPDIIITDIKMPETDGLSMIKQIKEDVPDSKIIILTGHRDFDFVHEALKLGVIDFLLKPSRIEELTSAISRAVKELNFQNQRSAELDKLSQMFVQNISVLREKLLYDIIHEINTNHEEIKEKLELFEMKQGEYRMLLVQNDAEESDGNELSQYDRHLYQFGIINTFIEIFADKFEVLHVTLDTVGIAFIVLPLEDAEEGLTEIINKKCTYLQEIIKNCFGFTVTIAISSKGSDYTELPQKFNECRAALEHKFYLGNNSIIYHSDVNTFFKYDDHSMLEKLQKALLEGIKSGNETAVEDRLKDIFSYIRNIDPSRKEFIKNFYWNTITSINNIRISLITGEDDKKIDYTELSGLYSLIEKCTNMDEMNTLLEESARSVVTKVNNYNNKSIKLILRKAVEYIHEHYHEQITLNEVAEHTFVSTYYISRMFKKEMGKNFVDYLNELRMEKARELLKDVRYKTYEVAEKVGIPDAHYFSRLFKKYVGMTPTEYREQ
ncbi:MAG TPA: response regulator transcription factor [Clostridiales bacterium]|jgi:two-component system response regulator YesN|nr:response regulator transcription factor [Clostridiales bacterium]HQD30124.1 response regulator transcription factor [Clostridiales bacterium]